MHIPPLSHIAQRGIPHYGLPITLPSRIRSRPGDRPVCVTQFPAIPATRSGKRTYPHTRNTRGFRVLRHNARKARAWHAEEQAEAPAPPQGGASSVRLLHPSANPSHLSPAGFWYICLDSKTVFIKHVRKGRCLLSSTKDAK